MAVDLTITNLLPLFGGQPVHFFPRRTPVEALADALRARRATALIKITPAHLALLTPAADAGAARGAAAPRW